MNTIKAWREIATPHDDVLRGTFQQAEFAADLSAVQDNKATEEYQNPVKFYERTFITEGMRLLLENIVKRLSGKGGDPVIQLQTSFGGGKTHTMLAVYHLVTSSTSASELRGIPSILDAAGIVDLPKARVAILDGNNLGPNETRQHGNYKVRTLWGELAWQLGGDEGYRIVEASDQSGTSPGKDTLVQLLSKFAPVVILIDELVAYIRQLSQDGNNTGGSYDASLSFVQALTEAAKQVPTCCILASLPESEIEAGGERGQQVLEALSKIFGRVQALWKSVSSEEAFEIVRRRLFKSDINQSDITATCNAYYELYLSDPQFPNETREGQYKERMERSYPVHPELFDRLYSDWSSLEKFQRTRGVLKLMAKVIHRLWKDGNSDYLITPGNLPLYDADIRTELINYLPNGWEQIIEGELDGEKSEANSLDSSNHFGQIMAARRITRALFLMTAPPIPNQTNRGVESGMLLLGVMQPGEQLGWYKDALDRLNDRLHYLNKANDRFYLDTRPNLRRTMEDRRKHIPTDVVSTYVRTTLQRQLNPTLFDGVHVFTSNHDIPDDTALRLVVLSDKDSYFSESSESAALLSARTYLKQRGDQPRLYQNRLVFLAVDNDSARNMRDQIRTALAWQSLVTDTMEARLNLDQYQLKQARQNQDQSLEAARHSVMEAYRWLMVPSQTASAGNVGSIELDLRQVSASQGVSAELERILKEHEDVITAWAPIHLANILKQWYWIKEPHVTAKTVWDDMCKYPYLPRLRNLDVFEKAISQSTQTTEYLGIAYGIENERYFSPHLGDNYSATYDSQMLLVKPEVLSSQIEEQRAQNDTKTDLPEDTFKQVDSTDDDLELTGSRKQSNLPQKFFGKKEFSVVASAPMKIKEIYDEIISQLSKDADSSVRVSIDIYAESPKGFDDHTQRAVKENSKVLGLEEFEFDDDGLSTV
jgi:predicted AAA+ superfamily ATPase